MHKTMHVAVSRIIDARPEQVYAVLSDYRQGHQAILPKEYFTKIVVEKGGQGAGTVLQTYMNVMGSKRVFHLVVSEPEPGRALVEREDDGSVETTFTVEPADSQQTRVTIATNSVSRPGLAGFIERLFNPPVMRRIYKKELEQLAGYMARSQS